MSDPAQAQYKQARNWIALGLAVLWTGAWYQHLDAERIQAINDMQACKSGTGLRATACAGLDFFLPTESTSSAGMTMSMLVVILVAPALLLPAGYLARRYVGMAQAREARQEQADLARAQARQQQESAARMAAHEAEADGARRQISRSEVIHKLGAINDLTDLLQAEADHERQMTIRLGVAQALRELAAKYTVAELAGLIRSDQVVQHTARTVVARLDATPLRTIVDIQALRAAAE